MEVSESRVGKTCAHATNGLQEPDCTCAHPACRSPHLTHVRRPCAAFEKVLGSVTLLEIPADLRYDLDVSLQDSPPSPMKQTFWFNNEQLNDVRTL